MKVTYSWTLGIRRWTFGGGGHYSAYHRESQARAVAVLGRGVKESLMEKVTYA